MKLSEIELEQEFNFIRFMMRVCHISCNKSIQKNTFFVAENFLSHLKSKKIVYINNLDEVNANFILSLELIIKSMQYKIFSDLNIKFEEANLALDYLIESQKYAEYALLADIEIDSYFSIFEFSEELICVEQVCFPRQQYLSLGAFYHENYCNICKSKSEKCNHIDRKPYMGELCLIKPLVKEWFQTSFVEIPKNKHARLLSFIENNIETNCVTLEKKPNPENSVNGHGRIVNCRMLWQAESKEEIIKTLLRFISD